MFDVTRTNVMPDLHVDVLFDPLWRAYRQWHAVEPGEFRLLVPQKVCLAMAGVCISCHKWDLCLFILLSFHCLLRPAECLGLMWNDLWWDELAQVLILQCLVS